jgi:hypothetical protein
MPTQFAVSERRFEPPFSDYKVRPGPKLFYLPSPRPRANRIRQRHVGGQKFFHKTSGHHSPPETRRSRRLRREEEEEGLLIILCAPPALCGHSAVNGGVILAQTFVKKIVATYLD